MTARWSNARDQHQQAVQLQAAVEQGARDLAARLKLLKLYRDNGWLVTSFGPDGTMIPDNEMTVSHWSLKMPRAYPVIVRSIEELRRKARGLR